MASCPSIITESLCPSVITEGQRPSVITEGERPSIIVSGKSFTEGFMVVAKSLVNDHY